MMKAARNMAMMSLDAAEGAMAEQELMDYHMYSLGRKTSILSNQTKQLSLLSASEVAAEKIYRMENIVPRYASSNMRNVDMKNAKVVLKFKNDKKAGLGMPLPAGTIRVYKAENKGCVV